MKVTGSISQLGVTGVISQKNVRGSISQKGVTGSISEGGFVGIAPVLQTATVEDAEKTKVVLTFDRNLDTSSVPATTDFTLSDRTITDVDISGVTITLTVSVAYAAPNTITVTYTQGSTPLQATDGADVADISESVTNNIVPLTPVLQSAYIINDAPADIYLEYDYTLDDTSIPDAGDFELSLGTISDINITAQYVIITVTENYEYGDEVTISYTKGDNPIKNYTTSDEADSFSDEEVTNNIIGGTIPILSTATIENATPTKVVLTYDQTLDETSIPDTTDFTLAGKTISLVEVSGTTVTVTVSIAYTVFDTIAISYTKGSNPIQGSVGRLDADDLSSQAVTNNITTVNFDLYANFYGDDHTFSDSDTLTAGNYGVQNGTFHVKDASTGVIAMADKYLTGYGKADWTSTILYAEAVNIAYGRVIKFNFICPQLIATFIAGLCKADLSDVQTSTIQFYSQTSGEILNIPSVHRLQTRVELVEYEIKFVLGGFDSNGYPYNGGSTTGYEYGYYVFVRSNIYPFWFLAGVSKDTIGTSVVPFISFYSTNTSPYGKLPVLKMMSYLHTNFQCLPTGFINTSANDQFTGFDVNNTLLSFRTDIANTEEVNLYFCIDDYTTPTEGYRLKIIRSTTIVLTMYRIDAGVETSIAVSNAVSTPRNFVWRFYKGLIFDLNALTNYTNLDISAYSGNTKAKIVNGANSKLIKVAWYPFGGEGEYRSTLKLTEPFFVGANAPGYGLPGETRNGHYFDVSSHSPTFGCEVISVIAYLVNGSNQMSVRFYSHSEQRWITDLDVTLTLRYAYSGTNAILCIASDPHFGYSAVDATVNYQYQIIPDLTTLGVTHCFILGDIVHDDADYYATYIAAKGLYPSATWKELNGNHDLVDDFKTDLGYDDVSHNETIGNCVFIMCGSVTDTTCVINHTFLGNSLNSNTDKNCFIMSHAGRLNTTVLTDTYHAEADADIETALGSKKFVAWFAGHQHGWQSNARKVTTAKYLNLGDNN